MEEKVKKFISFGERDFLVSQCLKTLDKSIELEKTNYQTSVSNRQRNANPFQRSKFIEDTFVLWTGLCQRIQTLNEICGLAEIGLLDKLWNQALISIDKNWFSGQIQNRTDKTIVEDLMLILRKRR